MKQFVVYPVQLIAAVFGIGKACGDIPYCIQHLQFQGLVPRVPALHQQDHEGPVLVQIGPAIPVGQGLPEVGHQQLVAIGPQLGGKVIHRVVQHPGIDGELLPGELLQAGQIEGLGLLAVLLLIHKFPPLGPGHLIAQGLVLVDILGGEARRFHGFHHLLRGHDLVLVPSPHVHRLLPVCFHHSGVAALHRDIAVELGGLRLQGVVGRVGAQEQGDAGHCGEIFFHRDLFLLMGCLLKSDLEGSLGRLPGNQLLPHGGENFILHQSSLLSATPGAGPGPG